MTTTTTFVSSLYQAFPQTKALSNDDLHELLTDEAYREAFVNTLPQVADKIESISKVAKDNETLAEKNQSLQPGLVQLRSETLAAFTEAEQLKARWKEIEKEQASLYQRFSASFLNLRLRHALVDQDDTSEALANAFIEGSRADTPSLDVSGTAGSNDRGARALEDFTREFKGARKVYHKRAIWSERWGRGEVSWRDD
ncbi:Uncharacterized conserved protein [Phaffia rhodozyma]|uniref:Uncharacterized conserved protein n=1 Tax=Phaffia rhodozyma TaxID=264483 RepID=A0A0F7SEH9_PHARH|nr:Uncharacterized conserved protein [Phaffia rhodozyma]